MSLACWPGMKHQEAAQQLQVPLWEPCFGELSTAHVQIVPQCFGVLTQDLADTLMAVHPETRFRLHANVRVLTAHRVADLSGLYANLDWFQQAARISRSLDATAYTAHAGSRVEASMSGMLDNARRCADLFACPVGVEGLYPTKGDPWLVSTWAEYREVFESGVPYAIDLSHIHILATSTGVREIGLLQEMLACERCIEVHVSDNDGRGDWHQVCEQQPWWYPLLDHIHDNAVVFSEGNHRRRRNPHARQHSQPQSQR